MTRDARAAYETLRQAWLGVVGQAPTLCELQGVLAIALHETGWGEYKPFGGSHNYGAVQCCPPGDDGSCPAGSFLASDTNPNKSSRRYAVCFKSYPTELDGARDLVRQLTAPRRPETAAALTTGDAAQIADAMYRERYYQGFDDGKSSMETRIAQRKRGYARAIDRNAADVAKRLGQPQCVSLKGSDPSGGGTSLAPWLFGAAAAAVATYVWLDRRRASMETAYEL